MSEIDDLYEYFGISEEEVQKRAIDEEDRGGYHDLYKEDDCQWLSKSVTDGGRHYRHCMHPNTKIDGCREESCAFALQLLAENRFEEYITAFGWVHLEKIVKSNSEARRLASNPDEEDPRSHNERFDPDELDFE